MVYKIKNDKFALHLKKYKIMYKLVLIFGLHSGQDYLELIPIVGMLSAIPKSEPGKILIFGEPSL